jgi:histone H3/H4
MESLPLRAGRVECIPDIEHDMLEQTLAIIASMMQQAAHDATLYCAEAKRIVVMPRDIELALKRLVLPGSAYWTRDDLSEEAQQIRHRLFVDASSEESDSGDSWVTDVGGEWSETAESDLTREMNAAPALFDKWQPEIPFMHSVKQAVIKRHRGRANQGP